MKSYATLAFVLFILTAVACAPSTTPPPPPPTPDAKATETRIAGNIFATQTASIPTATNTPLPTDTPANTPTPTLTDTPTLTFTPLPTDTPKPTSTRAPTNTPKPEPIATPYVPIGKDQLVHLTSAWDVTMISVRRDKTVFFYDNADTAFGIYASFLFRVKNLQSGTDHIGRTLGFMVRADAGKAIYHELFNTYEYKARWFYSCCIDPFSNMAPSEENVVLITFDVPEASKTLAFNFTEANPFERMVPNIGPTFSVPDFDQIAPRKAK